MFVGKKNFKQLIDTAFFATKPKKIFTTNLYMLTPKGKDKISKFYKNVVLY